MRTFTGRVYLRVVHSQRLLQDWLRVALHLNLRVHVYAGRAGRPASQSEEKVEEEGEEEGEKVIEGVLVYSTRVCPSLHIRVISRSRRTIVRTTSNREVEPPVSLGDRIFKDPISKGTCRPRVALVRLREI